MTQVTIFGAGNMARGIGTRLATGGHQIQVLAPTGEHAEALASELGGAASGDSASSVMTGEVVVLAVPYDAALEIATRRGADLAGKVVVDITNPVDWPSFDRLVTPPDSSAAEEIASRLPAGVPVVKAFNTTFAGTLVSGAVAGETLDVLLAADDDAARETVAKLVTDGGMRPVNAGPLRRAQQLEHLGFLHMAVQDALGTSQSSAVKFVTP